MGEFILLMHTDGGATRPEDWDRYIQALVQKGVFQGGSQIGPGACLRQRDFGAPAASSEQIGGFIRVEADDIGAAFELVNGNPAFVAGATVEVRELPKS